MFVRARLYIRSLFRSFSPIHLLQSFDLCHLPTQTHINANNSKPYIKSKHIVRVPLVMDKLMGRMVSIRWPFFRIVFIYIRFTVQHRSSYIISFSSSALSQELTRYQPTKLVKKKTNNHLPYTDIQFLCIAANVLNSSQSTITMNTYPIHVDLYVNAVIISCMY